jgi:hypothetical protein
MRTVERLKSYQPLEVGVLKKIQPTIKQLHLSSLLIIELYTIGSRADFFNCCSSITIHLPNTSFTIQS